MSTQHAAHSAEALRPREDDLADRPGPLERPVQRQGLGDRDGEGPLLPLPRHARPRRRAGRRADHRGRQPRHEERQARPAPALGRTSSPPRSTRTSASCPRAPRSRAIGSRSAASCTPAAPACPLELDATLRRVGDELEVEAVTAADHHRLGMTWNRLAHDPHAQQADRQGPARARRVAARRCGRRTGR